VKRFGAAGLAFAVATALAQQALEESIRRPGDVLLGGLRRSFARSMLAAIREDE
jgi:hypothetical protein